MNGSNELERVNNFCYLRDDVNGAGGSELAVAHRIGLEWKAFNCMYSMLWGKGHTWNIKGQIYRTCVRPVMTYSSETWVVRYLKMEYYEKQKNGCFE